MKITQLTTPQPPRGDDQENHTSHEIDMLEFENEERALSDDEVRRRKSRLKFEQKCDPGLHRKITSLN